MTLNLTATKTTINSGDQTRLKWRSRYATSCKLDGKTLAKNGSILVNPTHSRNYSVTCSGDISKTKTIFVKVERENSTPPPVNSPIVEPVYKHPSINFTTDKVFLKA